MQKILVTGSKGQLGSEIATVSKSFGQYEFLFTDVTELDICNEATVLAFFEENRPDWLINCAAYTAVDKAESDQENAFRINFHAVENLSKACNSVGCKFVHVSTDYVFDGMAYKPYCEDDKVNPIGVYGLSKLRGEEALLASACRGIVVRTSWLYSSVGNNFVKTMLRLGKEKPELRVIFDQIGTPTYAADLAIAIMQIICKSDNNECEFRTGIYHFSNEGVCSWFDFTKEIFRQTSVHTPVFPIESKDFPTPVKRPHYSVLNKAKIKNAFGIEIPYWTDSLKRCLDEL